MKEPASRSISHGFPSKFLDIAQILHRLEFASREHWNPRTDFLILQLFAFTVRKHVDLKFLNSAFDASFMDCLIQRYLSLSSYTDTPLRGFSIPCSLKNAHLSKRFGAINIADRKRKVQKRLAGIKCKGKGRGSLIPC